MMPTHWKKLNNPDYLGAYAFEPGEEKTGTIDFVRQESVTGSDGKKEDCIVCHFREKTLKPLILNVTNCKTITKLYKTPYIENWAGKQITMCVQQVKAFGDLVDAVRIKSKVTGTKTAEILCEGCGQVIKGMGQYGPEFVANKNKERYGRCLCVECGNKEKEAREARGSGNGDPGSSRTDSSTPLCSAQNDTMDDTKKDAANDLAAQLMAAAGE